MKLVMLNEKMCKNELHRGKHKVFKYVLREIKQEVRENEVSYAYQDCVNMKQFIVKGRFRHKVNLD